MDELRERREERLRKDTPFWHECIKNGVLESAIEHKRDRKSEKLRKMWWYGVPPSLRGLVWSRAMPNTLSITNGLCIHKNKNKHEQRAGNMVLCNRAVQHTGAADEDCAGANKAGAPGAALARPTVAQQCDEQQRRRQQRQRR